jgi:histone acetyltransferase (RNA polymerase elongator complex component)
MPLIIPFFLMNRGCPHRCLFCNPALTAGNQTGEITKAALDETVRAYLDRAGGRKGPVQIAFYGGTFTGMAQDEQRRLLEMAAPFLRDGTVDGIRISTRPDEIDPAGIDLLTAFGVTTVEMGVQSFDDDVLLRSRRGHTAADAVRASKLLKARGFETAIHLMAGLPGDSPERFAESVEKTISLVPDMVRIHPTVILRGTPLAAAYADGLYTPLELADAVVWCGEALKRLRGAGIPVIRLGLQTTRELEEPGAVVAGPFHPAFRSLVETAIFLDMAASLLAAAEGPRERARFLLAPADLSAFHGPGRGNLADLQKRFGPVDIGVVTDPAIRRGELILATGGRFFKTDFSGRITGRPG